jgi:flavin reductase (DIM6/NTAB) family NADH-FMN oxidoreductase RutF
MDPAQKKNALRKMTYGLYIATARDAESIAGGTINWVSQASFEPPLIMAGIKRDSRLHQAIENSKAFAVHIVGKSQKALATSFFKGGTEENGKLNGYPFTPGTTGSPVLTDPPAWFECRVLERFLRGDHTIFISEVVDAGVRSEEDALTIRDAGFTYAG